MEPSDLNRFSPDTGDDALDQLLRRNAPPALADGGFSSRVVAALPSPRSQTRSLRAVIIIVAGVAGTALAVAAFVASGGPASLSAIASDRLETLKPAFASASASVATGSGLATAAIATVASLLYVFPPRLARRLTAVF